VRATRLLAAVRTFFLNKKISLPYFEGLSDNQIVKKRISKVLIIALSTLSLAACSSLDGSSSLAGRVFTVTFYDDAATPNILGYSYVIEDKASVSKAAVHWDTMPKGGFRVFDKWVGVYSDDSSVDVTDITANCSVYATYKTSIYGWGVYFKNGGTSYVDSQWVKFGGDFSWPSGNPTESDIEYYNTSAFKGFSLVKDDTDQVIISQTDLKYAWGSGTPAAATAADKGTIYLDHDPTDSKGLQTYPTYVSNGKTWFSLGNLEDLNVKLAFNATFEDVYKNFEIEVYASKSAAESGTATPLKTFLVPYSNPLSYSIVGTKTTFTFSGSAGAENYDVTTSSAPFSWVGLYSGNGVSHIDGETVDRNHIVGSAYFYPVF
jgi:hypothetical protein